MSFPNITRFLSNTYEIIFNLSEIVLCEYSGIIFYGAIALGFSKRNRADFIVQLLKRCLLIWHN